MLLRLLVLLVVSPLQLQLVTDPSKADFILAHGTEAIGLPLPDGSSTRDMSLAQLEALISQCAEVARQQGREIPMVVANPDLVRGFRAYMVVCSGCDSIVLCVYVTFESQLPAVCVFAGS